MTGPSSPEPVRLDPRPWMTAPETRAVIEALERAGGQGAARFVGGCVRDALLGRDGGGAGAARLDVDIATPLTPEAVTSALRRVGLKAVPTGIEHGTVTAVAPDAEGQGRPFEITTLRRDVETDGRRAVVAFSTDWAEDAARRDFRLNALYMAPDGELFDPTGAGVADALAGRIVFVGDPETRIREDYLRVLRFFRFYAGYGRGAPDAAALEACARLKDGVAALSGERVSKELLKLLAAPEPRPALRLMEDAGVLGVVLPAARLPRLKGLVEVEARADTGLDTALRLAALLPDDREAARAASQRLRLPNALRDRLLAACPDGAGELDLHTQPAVIRAAVYRLGGRTVADRLMLRWALEPAGPDRPWRERLAIARGWTPPRFAVTGEDIRRAGLAEGPAVGQVLREVRDWWIAGDFPDDPARMRRVLGEAVARRLR